MSAQNSSRWRYGCGAMITVYVPRGYDYKAREVECGSTSYNGGVNQCGQCGSDPRLAPPPPPAYGDDI